MNNSSARKVYIVDGSRTPQLKSRGKVGPFSAGDLAVAAAKPLLLRHTFPLHALDEVILGCVMPDEREANVARVAALRMGIPQSVPAWTVQRNCASGMQSVDSAFRNIRNGDADLIGHAVAGNDRRLAVGVLRKDGADREIRRLNVLGLDAFVLQPPAHLAHRLCVPVEGRARRGRLAAHPG